MTTRVPTATISNGLPRLQQYGDDTGYGDATHSQQYINLAFQASYTALHRRPMVIEEFVKPFLNVVQTSAAGHSSLNLNPPAPQFLVIVPHFRVVASLAFPDSPYAVFLPPMKSELA